MDFLYWHTLIFLTVFNNNQPPTSLKPDEVDDVNASHVFRLPCIFGGCRDGRVDTKRIILVWNSKLGTMSLEM